MKFDLNEEGFSLVGEAASNVLGGLIQQWDLAKSGKPQLSILVGETGLGKTRIVQEFYACLAATENNGYWPNRIGDVEGFAVNPDGRKVDLKSEMPWMWWGIKFLEEKRPLRGKSEFELDFLDLNVHLDFIHKKKKVKQNEKEAGINFITGLSDLFFSIGPFGVVGSARTLIDMYKISIENRKIKNEPTPAENVVNYVEDMIKKLIPAIRIFVDRKDTGGLEVPVVLVLDDAQFLDESSVKVIQILFGEAQKNSWPLMIIATHWEREWNCFHEQFDPVDPKSLFDVYRATIVEDDGFRCGGNASIYRLDKIPSVDIKPLVAKILPGLDDHDLQSIVLECDGNMGDLIQVVGSLLDQPKRYFLDSDVSKGLTPRGKKKIADVSGKPIYGKVMSRFEDLDDEAQDVLTTGALLGQKYYSPLVAKLLTYSGGELDLGLIQDAQKYIEDNLAFVVRLDKFSREFKQRLYYKVAHDYGVKNGFYESHSLYLDVVLDELLREFSDGGEVLDKDFYLVQEIAADRFLESLERMDGDNPAYDRTLRIAALASVLNRARVFSDLRGLDYWWGRIFSAAQNLGTADLQNIKSCISSIVDAININPSHCDSAIEFISRYDDSNAISVENDSVTMAIDSLHILTIKNQIFRTRPHLFNTMLDSVKKMAEAMASFDGYVLAFEFSQYVINTYITYSELLLESGDFRSAEIWAEKTADFCFRMKLGSNDSPNFDLNISIALSKVGGILKSCGLSAERYSKYINESSSIVEGHSNTRSRDFDSRRNKASLKFKMADISKSNGDDSSVIEMHINSAIQELSEMLEVYEDHPELLRDLSLAYEKLSTLHESVDGDFSRAIIYALDSLEVSKTLHEKFSIDPQISRDYLVSLYQVGMLYKKSGNLESAASHFSLIVSNKGRVQSLSGLNYKAWLICFHAVLEVCKIKNLYGQGIVDELSMVMMWIDEFEMAKVSPENTNLVFGFESAVSCLFEVALEIGEFDIAESLNEYLDGWYGGQLSVGGDVRILCEYVKNKISAAFLERKRGDYAAAQKYLLDVLGWFKELRGRAGEHMEVNIALAKYNSEYGRVLVAMGDYESAVSVFENSLRECLGVLEICGFCDNSFSEIYLDLLSEYGAALYESDRNSDAVAVYESRFDLASRLVGDFKSIRFKRIYAESLAELGGVYQDFELDSFDPDKGWDLQLKAIEVCEDILSGSFKERKDVYLYLNSLVKVGGQGRMTLNESVYESTLDKYKKTALKYGVDEGAD